VVHFGAAAIAYASNLATDHAGAHRSFPKRPDRAARSAALRFANAAFAGDGATANALIAKGASVPCCDWTRHQASDYARRHYRVAGVIAAYPSYDIAFVGSYTKRGTRTKSGRIVGHPLFCTIERGTLHVEMTRQASRWFVWSFSPASDQFESTTHLNRGTCRA
jgi:hypothetical protein